ncbi:MAG: serine--pyruvate aminotransferase [Legionellales bacterium]|jgi:short-chain fatty acids transporter|nr:serine--pyruvate aminotransferase [Legionellales bacterium]|tara:strand:+ start:1642 stop:2994 length:1353 start_codon:yes stop_codon:yes gene_type:complete
MKIFQILARPFVAFVERYYPDAFIFVIILSIITFLSALVLTDATPSSALVAWGDGLSMLFTFTAQITIIMIGAHSLAHTELVQNFLTRIGQLPNTASQAYSLVAFTAGVASLCAWSFGLIIGAIVARSVAKECLKKPFKIHYPLLVASAYSGYVIWHMGYSSSSALFVATPGHLLESKIGIIPVTETILSPVNIVLALIGLAMITIICPLMRPKKEDIIEIDPDLLTDNHVKSEEKTNNTTLIEKFENHRSLSIFLATAIFIYIAVVYTIRGFSLTLDIVSWTFLAFGLLLANSAMHYIKLVNNAAGTVGPIILQYPFYSGIMGLMATTGLMKVISDWIISIATPETLGFFAFLSGGFINMFVPSGGGQWAVQGPIMIEAALSLNVDPAIVVLGVAYGDQWSNMIQPFWLIPILAITGLRMRQVLGYTFVIFLFSGLIYGSGILYMGAGV